MDCAYVCSGKQRYIMFSQKGLPFDVKGSGETYTGDLKEPGSSDSFGRQRSLPLPPEWVLREFTRVARVQNLLDSLPSLQYPKFLS